MPFKPESLFDPSTPCFIIAEAGVNHNGDIALARQLIDAALEAGADAVKFQTWITEKIITPDAPLAEYQRQNSAEDASQYAMLKRLELSQEAFQELKVYADSRGILFLSTPDEEDSADFLDSLNVPLFKIGSGEVTNLSLIQHIARKGKPVILSTGMSNLREVESAVEAFEETGNEQFALLHCVSNYPADPAECNLRAMHTLNAAFGYPVGFSDHTMGRDVAVAAVALGARIIEKHLTLDTTLPGPDHSSSLDPGEFRAMVDAIRQVEAALGDGRKRPSPSEKETRLVVQKSLVTKHPLPAQTVLSEADFALRRTSGGLPPQWMAFLLGRKLKRSLDVNQIITPEDVE